jgi:dTDP-4-dehydrorhamnose 3,5-epimerase-like enzyme
MSDVRTIQGGLSVDDRGTVSFVNEFDPMKAGVRRMYMVENHAARFVRAWHGHRNEAKYVTVVDGAAVVGVVALPTVQDPTHFEPGQWPYALDHFEPKRFVMSAAKPAVLYVPAGYANGFMTLAPRTKVLFFSTATLDESLNDDERFPPEQWNLWEVEER